MVKRLQKYPQFFPSLDPCSLQCDYVAPPVKQWSLLPTPSLWAGLVTYFCQQERMLASYMLRPQKTMQVSTLSWSPNLPCEHAGLTCWRKRGHMEQSQATEAEAILK